MRALSSPHSMRGAPVAVARQVSRRARTLFASPVRAELLSVRSNPLAASSLSVFAAADGRSVPVSELAPKSTVVRGRACRWYQPQLGCGRQLAL
jgi:hypothetical protein